MVVGDGGLFILLKSKLVTRQLHWGTEPQILWKQSASLLRNLGFATGKQRQDDWFRVPQTVLQAVTVRASTAF